MRTIANVAAVRRAARGITVGMLLVWGAFFVGQLWEWFVVRWSVLFERWAYAPPSLVWYQLAATLLLLAGLVIGLRRELPGGLMAAVAAGALFATTSLAYAALAAVPAALLVACWIIGQPRREAPDAVEGESIWDEPSLPPTPTHSRDRQFADACATSKAG